MLYFRGFDERDGKTNGIINTIAISTCCSSGRSGGPDIQSAADPPAQLGKQRKQEKQGGRSEATCR